MADGSYRFQQPGTGPYYYQQQNQQIHHQRQLARNGSPVNTGRLTYNNETPSPSRSPVSQTASHNPFGMYNQSHHQGQHAVINSGNGHQRFMQMNLGHKYQHQSQQHHHGQQNHHPQQNHGAHGMHGGMGHQHTFSSGTMANSTPNFTPSSLHNGNANNSHGGVGEPGNEHWQLQLQLVAESRQGASTQHRHSKKDGATRVKKGGSLISSEDPLGERESVEKNQDRAFDRNVRKLDQNRATAMGEAQRQDWDAMDLSGQGLRAITMDLFCHYMFLDKLFIDNNRLQKLPAAIGLLRNLSHLDASNNELSELPEKIGMLVNLKALLVFDNNIQTLPCELGYLFQLETLGIEGNPLDEKWKDVLIQDGTKALVVELRDKSNPGPPPHDRPMLIINEYPETNETFSVLDYNILCDKYATTAQYGYTPVNALVWDHRSKLIIEEIKGRDADIVCLQEVDKNTYEEFFRRELTYNDYKGVFWPRSRARTMPDKEANFVDGCAIFYKGRKFILLDKALIDFANMAINRPDMKGEHDIFNRVMPRDNIAVVTFLENRMTGSRMIVVNAHIFWDPAFTDVKLVQVAILMEQISKLADKWAYHPPCKDKTAFRHSEMDSQLDSGSPEEPAAEPGPSLEYSSGSQIPLIICGDFNSTMGSGVYDLIVDGSLSSDHGDLADRGYGKFTRDGLAHPFNLKSAYEGHLGFTNYTPGFTGVIDYIWYSSPLLSVTRLLGEVDQEYLQSVPGFPNHHFPSDHLALFAEFLVAPRKERKVVEADFGPQRERRS